MKSLSSGKVRGTLVLFLLRRSGLVRGRTGLVVAALCLFLLLMRLDGRAERLPFRAYTSADGMWNTFINYLMRDSRGFIWFCTRDGVTRFDGYRFVNYTIGDGSSSQHFSYMFETRKGVLWFVRNTGGLYRYDPDAAALPGATPLANLASADGRESLNAQLVLPGSFALFEDHDGRLWAAGAGLFLIEERAGRFSMHPAELNLPPGNKEPLDIQAMAEDQDGSLWLASNQGLLRRLRDGRVVQYLLDHDKQSIDSRLLLADRDGNLWVTHPGGLYILKPEPVSALAGSPPFSSRRLKARMADEQALFPRQPGETVDLSQIAAFRRGERKITGIYQQANGRIWMAVDGRLLVIEDQKLHSFTDLRIELATLVDDLDGDLWVGTLNGVLRLSSQGFRTYDRTDGLHGLEIDSLYEDEKHHLFAVDGQWFVGEMAEERFRSTRPNIARAVHRLWTSNLVLRDHSGEWWVLTSRGVYRFGRVKRVEGLASATPLAIYRTLNGLPGEYAYCIFEDTRGDLWISVRWTERGLSGLVRWNRSTGTFHAFSEAEGLPPGRSAASFAEDRSGGLWFGFYEGDLVRYADGRFRRFTRADGVPEGFITGLHVDQSGRLWMASSAGGVGRMDDPAAEHPRFSRYTTQEGLSSNNARCLTEDKDGRIYIGTVRGIDRLTPETGTIKHFGMADGLAGDFVISAYRDHKGSLWFGTFNGLSRLDPQPDHLSIAPGIMIDALRIAGIKQPLSELGTPEVGNLELSSAQRNLEIDFSGRGIAHAAALRYQYKLEGSDHDWSQPTDQRTVNYANLAPGAYRFLVRAVDSGGMASTQPASVSFRIFAPIWRRWWFLTLALLGLGYGIRALYLYRVGHLLALERIRTRIATDLHDDIGSSLSQIAVLSEVASRQMDGTAAAATPLSNIAGISRELVDSMSDIVWSINPHRDHLTDLSQRMRRFASDLFSAHDIEFRFDIQEASHPARLEADVRRQVFLIFKESVHNIVRHSRCKRVEINLKMEKHWIILTMADDGRGFDTAQVSDGHGLMSMQRRARELGAVLEIKSHPNSGTSICLRAPLVRRHTRVAEPT